MGIFRLYTGNDGQSHIEDQDLASHPALTLPQATAHIFFGELAVGRFIDWHPAPRRQSAANACHTVIPTQAAIQKRAGIGRG